MSGLYPMPEGRSDYRRL